MFTKHAYIEKQTSGINQLLAIFDVLLALAVIVSLFGIANTLVLATFERTREIGMLRAVGMTRRQVRRMVRHESIITALLGSAMGIAVGIGLAAIVVAVFGHLGFTFALPIGGLAVLVARRHRGRHAGGDAARAARGADGRPRRPGLRVGARRPGRPA